MPVISAASIRTSSDNQEDVDCITIIQRSLEELQQFKVVALTLGKFGGEIGPDRWKDTGLNIMLYPRMSDCLMGAVVSRA